MTITRADEYEPLRIVPANVRDGRSRQRANSLIGAGWTKERPAKVIRYRRH